MECVFRNDGVAHGFDRSLVTHERTARYCTACYHRCGMDVSSICLVSCTLISVIEPLFTHSRCHRQLARRNADLSMDRLIIQVHTAAVHEFSVASDRLKGTNDSLEGTECH